MLKKTFITLIDKYLSGTATTSERRLIEAYMDKLEAEKVAVAAPAIKEDMWQAILAGTVEEAVPVRQLNRYVKTWVYWSAACMGAIVATTLMWLNYRKPLPELAKENNAKTTVPVLIRHIENTRDRDTAVLLPDGSGVVLSGHSALTFSEPFVNRRELSLTGKAEFNVVTDKVHPFRVVSRAVSTVVLGTRFRVTAYKKSSQIKVRLYEGKVMVQPVNRLDKKMPADFRLQPGQEFIYSNNAMAYVRNSGSRAEGAEHDATEVAGRGLTVPGSNSEAWNLFNNQPLGLVFDQLSELYNVKIIYNKQDVKRKYFVGRFNKSDSLDIILKYITTANKLYFDKKENGYYIYR